VEHGCSQLITLTILITTEKENIWLKHTNIMVVLPVSVVFNIKGQQYPYMPPGLRLRN
jgi:hypothetical protein